MNPNLAGCLFGGLISFLVVGIWEWKRNNQSLRKSAWLALVIAVVGMFFGYVLRVAFSPPAAVEKTVSEKISVVKTLECGQAYTLDFSEAKTANVIERYICQFSTGMKTISVPFVAPEFLVVPQAEAGTRFVFQILTSGTGAMAALVHGSPTREQYEISAASCGLTSVTTGIVGRDYVLVDSTSVQAKIRVQFICAL